MSPSFPTPSQDDPVGAASIGVAAAPGPDAVPDLSIVVPMYNEEEGIDAFFFEMEQVLADLGVTWEIVCVNDGSRDRTFERLVMHHIREPRIKVIDLSRNFGKEAALTAGLEHAAGRAVVPIDADLQDPPEVIGEMLDRWREGYEVVLGVRAARRTDTLGKRLTAGLFYRVINLLSPLQIPENTGDFRLMDARVVRDLVRLPERNRFMKGLFAWVGYRQTVVTYDRMPRRAGTSAWGYWKLWNFALDGITAFSTTPLKIWTYVGFVLSALTFLYGFYLVVRTLVWGVDVPGYASLMVAILFMNGLQMISMGVLGEYIGRIYQESKQRPVYLVRQAFGVHRPGDAP